jgi:uncharacterized protein
MSLAKRIIIGTIAGITILVTALCLYLKFHVPELSDKYGKVDAQLYVGDSDNQPLIVAFGGSQGGNTWTEGYWSDMRKRFLNEGYAVLSIGYFLTENTPETLDRISLNAIYDTIQKRSDHPKIDKIKIALLGSSKGGELVLNLASRYGGFDAVVALVPSHVTFPGYTPTLNTSSWTYNDKELDFVKIPYPELIWSVIKNDTKLRLELIIEGTKQSEESIIEVENITAPLLVMSAKDDQLWPSDYMSGMVVERLKEHHFGYHYEHYSFQGGHHDTKKHFDVVFKFLDEHFKSK